MTVREQCKRRFGDKPCIKTPTETAECVDWCPLLNKRLDLELEQMVQLDLPLGKAA